MNNDRENEPLLGGIRHFPGSITFILIVVFFELFTFQGLRTILVLYLTQELKYDDDTATIIFHSSTMMLFAFSLVGAIIADGWWGKFKTIFWLLVVYTFGVSIIAIGSVSSWNLPAKEFTIIGLALYALGSGGVKTCIAAFGGEQFQGPNQSAPLNKFFSTMFFIGSLGSILATLVTPLLRQEKCFSMDRCFLAAFGLPALFMLISVFIFVLGFSKYRFVSTPENTTVKVVQCIGNAIMSRKNEENAIFRDHWIDYAELHHDRNLVKNSKVFVNLLLLFVPFPLFWALSEQQGSRWVTQGLKMNGDIGVYNLEADQMQLADPLLNMILIPLFDMAIYPLLKVVGISRPLQKMTIGGILAGLSFLCSMTLQLNIEQSPLGSVNILWQLPQYTVLGMAEVMFVNTGVEFVFTQAPPSMKSVVLALWLSTVAGGDLLVTLIVTSGIIKDLAMEFLLYAVLMFLDMLLFTWLARRYRIITTEIDNT